MQSTRLQQVLHNPVLSEAAHSLAPVRQAACLCVVFQDFYLGSVLKGTHIHPHTGETFQVRLPGMQSRLPSGWQALDAQETAPEHDLYRAKDQKELYQAQALEPNGTTIE